VDFSGYPETQYAIADGEVPQDFPRGSHRVLVKDDRQRIWAYHEGVDLAGPAMARIAKDYGYTLAELRKLGRW
jgi:hypothetical protein